MTIADFFLKNARCEHGNGSPMSNSAWCDSKKDCTVLKVHDMCHNPKFFCQKQITFTPRQLQMEGAGFKNTMKTIFKGSQTAWNKFWKPAVNVAAPFIGMAVCVKKRILKLSRRRLII